MKLRSNALLLTALVLAGCASAPRTIPVQDKNQLKEVCIIRNDKVLVSDFTLVLQNRLDHHQIANWVVEPDSTANCPTTLTYTATRGWDFAPYLNHAKIELWQNGKNIGQAEYRLRNGFKKWQKTATKINPVIDEMITGVRKR